MLLDRTHCNSNIVIGIAPIIDFVAGACELFLLATMLISLNFIPWQKSGVTLIAPIYFVVMVYAMALALVIGISGVLGLSFEFVEADFVKWVLFRSVSEGLAIFYLHNGIGLRALKHSIGGGIFWSLVSGGMPVVIYYMSDDRDLLGFLITTILFLCTLLVFYFVAWIAPRKLLHRRPALINYALMNMVTLVFFIFALSSLIVNNASSSCGVEIMITLFYDLQPFIILYSIRQDSLFWQGSECKTQ